MSKSDELAKAALDTVINYFGLKLGSREQKEAESSASHAIRVLALSKSIGELKEDSTDEEPASEDIIWECPIRISLSTQSTEAEAKGFWKMEVENGRVNFTRYSSGRPTEAYAPVNLEKAVVYAAAIIAGYDPPRNLKFSDNK